MVDQSCPGGSKGLLIAATLVGSVFPAQRAWQSIKRFSLDINVLMVIAVIGAIAIREYEEAAMVVTLSPRRSGSRRRARSRPQGDPACWISRPAGCSFATVPVIVSTASSWRSGYADDGPARRQVRARRHCLQRALRHGPGADHGQSMPVEKTKSDEVFAGTINGRGALTLS